MILSVGEILFDYFPGYRRMGGAPYNFAFHLKYLGYDVRFISRVGMDKAGGEIRAAVKAHGFDADDLQADSDRPTGGVDIVLRAEGLPEFSIRKNAAYDRLELNGRVRAYCGVPPELIYFGTLIQRTADGLKTVQAILNDRPPGTRALYDVNLRPDCYSTETVKRSLAQADIVKLNTDELEVVAGMADVHGDEDHRALALMNTFAIETLCLTDGARGSRIYRNGASYNMAASRHIEIADTVGAGDAFASVLAVGCLKGWGPEKILRHAGLVAGDICGIRGAVPDGPGFYAPYQEILGKENHEQ